MDDYRPYENEYVLSGMEIDAHVVLITKFKEFEGVDT